MSDSMGRRLQTSREAGVLFVVAGVLFAGLCPAGDAPYATPRLIRYSFTLQNPTHKQVSRAVLEAYVPVKRTATQMCRDVDVSHPFTLEQDTLGNQAVMIVFSNLPPYSVKLVTIEARLRLAARPVSLGPADRDWLAAGRYIETDNKRFEQLAPSLPADETDAEHANRIFRWVRRHVRDTGYCRRPRGALYALESRQGDCTEMMYLFVALCRRAGIPARGVGGYVYGRDAVLSPSAYHNWAEFQADGVWCLADPSGNVFCPEGTTHLATRIIAGGGDDLLGDFPRFRYRPQTLKVRMN